MQCVDLGGRRIIKKVDVFAAAMTESCAGWRSFFQGEDGIRGVGRYRGLGDVYKRQHRY